jgi:hypothetical protein
MCRNADFLGEVIFTSKNNGNKLVLALREKIQISERLSWSKSKRKMIKRYISLHYVALSKSTLRIRKSNGIDYLTDRERRKFKG